MAIGRARAAGGCPSGKRLHLAGAAAAALLATAPGHGQQPSCSPREAQAGPSALAVDECRTSSLDAEKVREDYEIELELGQSVQIDMVSEALDSGLSIFPPGASEPLLVDDDGGGALNARVRFAAPLAGKYRIRAESFSRTPGPYSLSVRSAARRNPPPVVPLGRLTPQVRSVPGALRADTALFRDRASYAEYTFEADKGSLIQIDMEAGGFDPVLRLVKEQADGELYEITDDDGGGGRNARLVAMLPEAGPYKVQALATGEAEGDFTLKVQRVDRPPPLDRQGRVVVATGQPHGGKLSLAKSGLGRDRDTGEVIYLYQDFSLKVTAGQTYIVDVKSSEFDAVLEAGGDSPIGFAAAMTNDDAFGSDPRLVLTPETDGFVNLRARSLGVDEGAYNMIVVREPRRPRS